VDHESRVRIAPFFSSGFLARWRSLREPSSKKSAPKTRPLLSRCAPSSRVQRIASAPRSSPTSCVGRRVPAALGELRSAFGLRYSSTGRLAPLACRALVRFAHEDLARWLPTAARPLRGSDHRRSKLQRGSPRSARLTDASARHRSVDCQQRERIESAEVRQIVGRLVLALPVDVVGFEHVTDDLAEFGEFRVDRRGSLPGVEFGVDVPLLPVLGDAR